MFPNSYVKLTKSVITSSLSQVKIICMYMQMYKAHQIIIWPTLEESFAKV